MTASFRASKARVERSRLHGRVTSGLRVDGTIPPGRVVYMDPYIKDFLGCQWHLLSIHCNSTAAQTFISCVLAKDL